MSRIIVFHYTDNGRVPKMTEQDIADIKQKFNEVLKDYPQVKLNGIFSSEDGYGFCDWEAPDTETVNEIVIKVGGSAPADGSFVVNRLI